MLVNKLVSDQTGDEVQDCGEQITVVENVVDFGVHDFGVEGEADFDVEPEYFVDVDVARDAGRVSEEFDAILIRKVLKMD